MLVRVGSSKRRLTPRVKTKITVETASNVVSLTGGVAKAVSPKARQENQEEE